MSKTVNTLIVSVDGVLEVISDIYSLDGTEYEDGLRSKLRKYRGKGIVALGIESTLFEMDPFRMDAYHIFIYRESAGRYDWTTYNKALIECPDAPKIYEIAKSLNFLM